MLCATQYTQLGVLFRKELSDVSKSKSLIEIKILRKTLDHLNRKITESLYIREKRPAMNENVYAVLATTVALMADSSLTDIHSVVFSFTF